LAAPQGFEPDWVSRNRCKGRKPLNLAAVLKRKIRPAFDKLGITGVGWHTFRHTVRTMLAKMGEHQLTIRDYLRHSNLHVTNKYLEATPNSKRLAQDKLVDAILPAGVLRGKRSSSEVCCPRGIHTGDAGGALVVP